MNLIAPIPLRFETENLLIRRYKLADEQALFEAASSSIPEVFEYLPWCRPDYSHDDAKDWLLSIEPSWKDANAYSFAIFDKREEILHGGCGINRIDEHPIGNLGYWIRTSSTGKGIATEATIGLIEFGLSHLGMQRIEIIMSTGNIPSKKVAEASGGVFEGTARNRLLLHGKNHDAHVYSITPEDNRLTT